MNGAFGEFVVVPAGHASHLPGDTDFARGAMVEPPSCVVHTMARIGSVLGESVVLAGARTMGMLLQQLLHLAGASSITVMDRFIETATLRDRPLRLVSFSDFLQQVRSGKG
jgi:NADPH2:quinone reductase